MILHLMKYLIVISLVLLLCRNTEAGTFYFRIDGIKQPIFNRYGKVLSVNKRIVYSKSVRSLNYGGEWLFPNLSEYNVLQRHQKAGVLIIETEGNIPSGRNYTVIEIYKFRKGKFIPHRTKAYNFNVESMTETEFKETSLVWGAKREILIPPIESCTTCPLKGERNGK